MTINKKITKNILMQRYGDNYICDQSEMFSYLSDVNNMVLISLESIIFICRTNIIVYIRKHSKYKKMVEFLKPK